MLRSYGAIPLGHVVVLNKHRDNFIFSVTLKKIITLYYIIILLHSPDFGRDLKSTATGINAKCLNEMVVCIMICLVYSEDGCSVYC